MKQVQEKRKAETFSLEKMTKWKTFKKSKNEEMNKKWKNKNQVKRQKNGRKKVGKNEKKTQRGTTRDGSKNWCVIEELSREIATKLRPKKKSDFEHPTQTKKMKENERKWKKVKESERKLKENWKKN